MLPLLSVYPETASERDRWIVARRGERIALDPVRPFGFFVEGERTVEGSVVPTATVFLTNRECPWRCLMCDLWRNTLTESVPAGAIPQQIDYALGHLPAAQQIKLYNSGSFFDRRAIPSQDYDAIARRLFGFGRVIVECHPALVGDACLRFRDLLHGRLEVAMGLETVHPEILPRLNKRMTQEMFRSAALFLRNNEIDVRAFILVKPPFMREQDAVAWALRSLEFGFACGATAVTLIPTRGGNGAMEALAASGDFAPPALRTLELAAEQGMLMKRGRVFADLWDAEQWPGCAKCRESRIARLRTMNLTQTVPAAIACNACAEIG
jgi:archaeosine synthase beta-subunit